MIAEDDFAARLDRAIAGSTPTLIDAKPIRNEHTLALSNLISYLMAISKWPSTLGVA
jgi:hypothetical protein